MGQGSPTRQRFKYDTHPQAPSNGQNQARRKLYRYGRTEPSRISILRWLQTGVCFLNKMHKTKQPTHHRVTTQPNKREGDDSQTTIAGSANRFPISEPLYKNAETSRNKKYNPSRRCRVAPRLRQPCKPSIDGIPPVESQLADIIMGSAEPDSS